MKRLPGSLAAAAVGVFGAIVLSGGCTQQVEPVPVRALERSGRIAFVCLDAPGTQPGPGRPIADCTRAVAKDRNDYRVDASGKTTLPHLYALVTQTTRGEVAVIDMTTNKDAIVDQDESIPGANFLHVGAQPVDIVATEGGGAVFVSVAEIGREGIFALPSAMLRPGAINLDKADAGERSPPALSSWPACALPAAPGDMLILLDPPMGDAERASCDGAYSMDDTTPHPNGDLSREGPGRRKIVVTLPDLGGLAVIDAQSLLDKPAGSFDACPIERWLPLKVELLAPLVPRPYASDGACVNPAPPEPSAGVSFTPRPAGMGFAAGRLYVADLDAPVIHVVDMATPCEPVELPPLLPSSLDDPERVVTTSRLAVAPDLTPDFRRYLYAIDVDQGTTMAFDVTGDAQSTRRPLLRPDPQWNPFQVRDRLQFVAPAEDIVILSRDVPETLPVTGVAPYGTRCNPDPALVVCDETTATCDPETGYRGKAKPTKLRGMYAFLLLSTGQVSIIDIDDYDALCRGPEQYRDLYGCPPSSVPLADLPRTEQFVLPRSSSNKVDVLTISGEVSCNVVRAHTARSRNSIITTEATGRNEPGLQIFPLLYDKNGTPIPLQAEDSSILMRATLPAPPACQRDADCHPPATCAGTGQGTRKFCATLCSADADCLAPKKCTGVDEASNKFCEDPPAETPCTENADCFSWKQCNTTRGICEPTHVTLAVGSGVRSVDLKTGLVYDAEQKPKHTLLMNLEDPRVHVADQPWAVVYEGIFLSGKVAQLCLSGSSGGTGGAGGSDYMQGCPEIPPGRAGLYSPDGRFCIAGVQSEQAVRAQLKAEGQPESEAIDLADYVQITTDLIDKNNVYWTSSPPACTHLQSEFQHNDLHLACTSTFGRAETLQPARDLYVKEAYQDHLEVQPKPFFDPATMKQREVHIDDIKCCFPSLVSFNVRAGKQWIVLGQASGFIHHVIEDADSGVCRNSCDPAASRRNSRVRMAPPGAVLRDGDPLAFIHPMFRFSINEHACMTDDDCHPGFPCQGGRCVPQPDTQFHLTTQGGFRPLTISLSGTAALQPQAIVFVKSTNELAVTDGSIEGLIMVGVDGLGVSRQYF